MKSKWRLYIVITLIIILAGGLLITKGTDAVSQANLRMTREKGQSDLSMFLIRISIPTSTDLLPGMTAEVQLGF
ncbi:hypothetical protein P9222_21360 [Paenibacillus amylolyticus]|nr:hypothetical protein [Paenibacillus amylolyticus]WFR61049.1 hypothetical protein P9222_21360 [Paenibacillus amylolyticus]